MKKVLVFGGTTEGRILAETLSQSNIAVHVSVATDYGEQVIEEKNNLKILKGRLDVPSMKRLIKENKYHMVIDATHPFATEVSESIKNSCQEIGLPLLRFERNVELEKYSNVTFTENALECCNLLSKTSGKILLTTGSKDLNVFCKSPSLRERLVVRVLPGLESINLCYENNLEGKQIIAMQGPFSKNMNIAQIEDYDISVLVTKESGKTGGTDSKIEAALEKGIKCIIIKKPSTKTKDSELSPNYFQCTSMRQIYDAIEENLSIKINSTKNIHVDLIGIGMGNEKNMTLEAAEKIQKAQAIFGAERMISAIKTNAKKYPHYLAKDIVPVLKGFLNSDSEINKVCVLFSGDTGFFSGAAKLQKELEKAENVTVKNIAGISSLSYLASRIGQTYQDAVIISLHGTDESFWKPELDNALTRLKKIFLLTSGIQDVHKVGNLVSLYNKSGEKKYRMAIGFNLSYENENVQIINPEDCRFFTEEGLYSILLWVE